MPLLLLPDDGRSFAALEQRQIRVLVALDGSAFSEALLEPVAYLLAGLAQAKSQSAALLLLQVVGIPASYGRFRSQIAPPGSERRST